jgi:disulfide bond formation protein DsbB
MKIETFQRITLWLGIILILSVLSLLFYLFKYQQTLLSDPCKLCMDKGFSCFKWRV